GEVWIGGEAVLVVAVENGPEGSAGNVCEPPLHEGERNISQHPHVVSDVARGCRRDGSEPSWFLRGERPLILAAVRSAPRDHLAVAERLPRQPRHRVRAVGPFMDPLIELAAGITTASRIDRSI